MAGYRSGGYRGGSARSFGGSGRYTSSSRSSSGSSRYSSSSRSSSGSSRSGYSGGSSGAGGKGGGRTYSANTRSYVAGKIAGQYQAKGYSKARAQHIGNQVVSKAGATFRSGRGATSSWTAGVVTGRNQGLYGYGLARSAYIGNAVARKQAATRSRSAGQSASSSPAVTSKLTNNTARSGTPIRSASTPRGTRRITKLIGQRTSVISPKSRQKHPIRPASKIVEFGGRSTSAPGPSAESSPSQSKIVGWGEAGQGASVSSKILRFDTTAGVAGASSGMDPISGGGENESR